MNENKTNINWYPGHMAKAKREIKEKIDLVDAVIMVVDARIPKSSFVKDIENFTNKKFKIIIFSKYDLCDKQKTLKWKEYYEKENYKVILSDKDNNIKVELQNNLEEIMKEVNVKRIEKGLLPKKIRAIIIGVTNVGKSSLINKIAGQKRTVVGNKPGVTKNISVIKINDKIELLDTPGVLWPKFEERTLALNLASMSIIKEEVLSTDEVAFYILEKLSEFYPKILEEKFGIKEFREDNIEEIYLNICDYKKIPVKNNEIDYDRVNQLVINSIKNESIKNITFDEI